MALHHAGAKLFPVHMLILCSVEIEQQITASNKKALYFLFEEHRCAVNLIALVLVFPDKIVRVFKQHAYNFVRPCYSGACT